MKYHRELCSIGKIWLARNFLEGIYQSTTSTAGIGQRKHSNSMLYCVTVNGRSGKAYYLERWNFDSGKV